MMIWTVIGYSMDRIYSVEARAAMSSVDASVVIISIADTIILILYVYLQAATTK